MTGFLMGFVDGGGGGGPTFAMVAPSWGSVDGGTTVWIPVTDSALVDSATVGGVALTSFARVSPTCVRGVTGIAVTPGLSDVVLTGSSGSATLTGGFLYFDPTDANYTPNTSFVAPEYDDIPGTPTGLWHARTGVDISAGSAPVPFGSGGAPLFDGTTTNVLRDAATPSSTWYGISQRHIVATLDTLAISNNDTGNVYGNAAVYCDDGGALGLTIYRTGAGPYTYHATVFEYDVSSTFKTASIDISSLVDSSGASLSTLVLEAKKTTDPADSTVKLWIRANGGAWTIGDACGDLNAATRAGLLHVGRGYGGDRIDGPIRSLVITPAAQDATYSSTAVQWAPRVPSGWVRRNTHGMPTTPDNFETRQSSMTYRLASGRLLCVGGFNVSQLVWGEWVTNEVWASDDEGDTWFLLLAHVTDPPTSGAGARFRPCHSVAHAVWNGVAVLAGMDPTFQTTGDGDVWVSDSTGAVWTRVTTTAPCLGRTMHMMGCLGSDLYMGGGQHTTTDKTTRILDWWKSSDGGATWTQVADPIWSARGMIYSIPALDGKLYLTGGSVYDNVTPDIYNGVYSFDGTTWVEILPDGHAQWTALQYSVPCILHGRIWLFNGFDALGTNADVRRALYSDDKGATWSSYVGGSGGGPSHADMALAATSRIVRTAGYSTGIEDGRPIQVFALEGSTP